MQGVRWSDHHWRLLDVDGLLLCVFFLCKTYQTEHFFTDHYTTNNVALIPLELVQSNRDSVHKAREAYHITRGNTPQPLGLHKLKKAKCNIFYVLCYFRSAFFCFTFSMSVVSFSNFTLEKKIRYFSPHHCHIRLQSLSI